MKRLIMLVGLPATGKSTWLRFYESAMEIHYQWPTTIVTGNELVVLSTDNNVMQIKKAEETYDQAWPRVVNQADRKFFSDLDQCLEAHINIVIDRTNLSVNARKKIISRVNPAEYQIEAFVFGTDLPADLWQYRLASRPNKTIPTHVLDNMARSFQYPTKDEGFTSIQNVK